MKGFRQFILRGNVVDLAVGVVIGGAFGAIVTALVKDLVTPLIGAFGVVPKFEDLNFALNGSKFGIGDFINALISFLLIAAVIYFLVVLPVNALMARAKRGEVPPDPSTKKCPECLSEIPIAARKCAHCTSVVA